MTCVFIYFQLNQGRSSSCRDDWRKDSTDTVMLRDLFEYNYDTKRVLLVFFYSCNSSGKTEAAGPHMDGFLISSGSNGIWSRFEF